MPPRKSSPKLPAPPSLDAASLSPTGRLDRFVKLCGHWSVNPEDVPFVAVLFSDGRVAFVCTDSFTQAMLHQHRASVLVTERSRLGDLYSVGVRVQAESGRFAEADGFAYLPADARQPAWQFRAATAAHDMALARAVLLLCDVPGSHARELALLDPLAAPLGSEDEPPAPEAVENGRLTTWQKQHLHDRLEAAKCSVSDFCHHFGITSGNPGDLHASKLFPALEMIARRQARGPRQPNRNPQPQTPDEEYP